MEIAIAHTREVIAKVTAAIRRAQPTMGLEVKKAIPNPSTIIDATLIIKRESWLAIMGQDLTGLTLGRVLFKGEGGGVSE